MAGDEERELLGLEDAELYQYAFLAQLGGPGYTYALNDLRSYR